MSCHVLGVLFSARKHGWTSRLLDAGLEGAASVEGVTVEKINAHKYKYIPCISDMACIRDPEHGCILDDDFGRYGEGILYRKVRDANGIFVADPVYLWGTSALLRMFLERMYPFIWSGEINGQPFASVSCASNSGFQYWATSDIPRQIFNFGSRYIGGVAVHTSYFEEGLKKARELGKKLGEFALQDAKGRIKLTDLEKFSLYREPWDVSEAYLIQLTNGSMKAEESMSKKALEKDTFKRPDALEILKEADDKIQKAFKAWNNGDRATAESELSDGTALWTEATWREFLEEKVARCKKPAAYRPMPE
ncbi:MAG: flavodoxin family protein [Chloroflexota bacterium]